MKKPTRSLRLLRTAWFRANGRHLEVRSVKQRRIPRYPRGEYLRRPQTWGELAIHRLLPPALLLALLESCESVGPTGEPLSDPTMVTEAEARGIIDAAFLRRNIRLTPDVKIRPAGLTDTVSLDGYNDSLKVGYEYLAESDQSSFLPVVQMALEGDPSRHIRIVKKLYDTPDHQQILRGQVDSFVDSLKVAGVI